VRWLQNMAHKFCVCLFTAVYQKKREEKKLGGILIGWVASKKKASGCAPPANTLQYCTSAIFQIIILRYANKQKIKDTRIERLVKVQVVEILYIITAKI